LREIRQQLYSSLCELVNVTTVRSNWKFRMKLITTT
jgi:hypothetical protein